VLVIRRLIAEIVSFLAEGAADEAGEHRYG
jgi:hypothetical protein